jgi:hypothetical protein
MAVGINGSVVRLSVLLYNPKIRRNVPGLPEFLVNFSAVYQGFI